MVSAAVGAAQRSLSPGGLPTAATDYWEHGTQVTLGTAAPLLTGLRAATDIAAEMWAISAVGVAQTARVWAEGAGGAPDAEEIRDTGGARDADTGGARDADTGGARDADTGGARDADTGKGPEVGKGPDTGKRPDTGKGPDTGRGPTWARVPTRAGDPTRGSARIMAGAQTLGRDRTPGNGPTQVRART